MFKTESVRNRDCKQQQKMEEYEKMERGGKEELKREKASKKG